MYYSCDIHLKKTLLHKYLLISLASLITFWTLLRIHANACKSNTCPIPQCNAIRKRIRQLRLKQQAMDDRRRQEMNRHYRAGMMSGN